MRTEEEAVVGGEDDVGVGEATVRLELLDDLLDQVVDRQHGAQPVLVEGVDLLLHLGREQGHLSDPSWLVARVPFVERGDARGLLVGEKALVPRRTVGRGVGRRGSHVEEEGLRTLGHRRLDGGHRALGEDVGQVVLGVAGDDAVVVDREVDVVSRIGAPCRSEIRVPFVPARRHVGGVSLVLSRSGTCRPGASYTPPP